VQVPNRDLSFQTRQGVHSAVLNLYGRITTPGGVVVQTFEDVISRDYPESLFQSSLNLSSVYQKSLPLRSGLYRLDLVVKDTLSGNLGVFKTALRVPHFEDDKIDASSLILADQIEPVPSQQIGTGQFVLKLLQSPPAPQPEILQYEKTRHLSSALQLEAGRYPAQDQRLRDLSHHEGPAGDLAFCRNRGSLHQGGEQTHHPALSAGGFAQRPAATPSK